MRKIVALLALSPLFWGCATQDRIDDSPEVVETVRQSIYDYTGQRVFNSNPVPSLDWGVLTTIGDFDSCDATVTTSDTDWAKVNNSANSVVCIDAGDHTSKGDMDITDGGSAGPNLTISAVTLNDPVQIDFTAAHSLSTNDIIWFDENVGGTWELRWRYCKVTVVDSDSITCQGEDATGAGNQPAWTAYTSGGIAKKINFKVIRHATALAQHPQLTADASKAKVQAFNCDPFGTTTDDNYIFVWGLTVPDHTSETTLINVIDCDHFVTAFNEVKSSTSVPNAFVRYRTGSDFGVIQDNYVELSTTSATTESVMFTLADGVDGTRIISNETKNTTGHSVLQANTGTGDYFGTVIAGNSFYITTDIYADCDGTLNPSGICACSEGAIDFKDSINGVRTTNKDQFVRVEANMFHGFRHSVDENTCSGISLATGAAIDTSIAGEKCCVLFRNNVIWDAQQGIAMSGATDNVVKYWSIVGNIFSDISHPKNAASNSWHQRSVVFNFFAGSGGNGGSLNEIALNTVNGADHWYATGSTADGEITCNLLIDSGSRGGSVDALDIDNNYVYGNTTGEQAGDTDGGVTANANMADLTLQPFIISSAATNVTLTDVLSTDTSPHKNDCVNVGTTGDGISDEAVTF